MAAGDIACGTSSSGSSCQQLVTSDLLVDGNPDVVLPLGDIQYECGELSEFQSFYGPSWGRVKDKTRPVPGNHEYETSQDPASNCPNFPTGAPGYYSYFGQAASPLDDQCGVECKGYYSYDVGAWHVVALNSNCTRPGIG